MCLEQMLAVAAFTYHDVPVRVVISRGTTASQLHLSQWIMLHVDVTSWWLAVAVTADDRLDVRWVSVVRFEIERVRKRMGACCMLLNVVCDIDDELAAEYVVCDGEVAQWAIQCGDEVEVEECVLTTWTEMRRKLLWKAGG